MARQQRVRGVAQNERLCKLDYYFRHAPNVTTANLKSKNPGDAMSSDKQGGKIAFVCDVRSARFEAEATNQQKPVVLRHCNATTPLYIYQGTKGPIFPRRYSPQAAPNFIGL